MKMVLNGSAILMGTEYTSDGMTFQQVSNIQFLLEMQI